MRIEARRDTIEVRVGAKFDAMDVQKVEEALAALGPFARLTIDFGLVRDCDDAALALLASTLGALHGGEVALSGLSQHQWRLLSYLGLQPRQEPAAEANSPKVLH
jgi:anti-anti-sigma regulatory factor